MNKNNFFVLPDQKEMLARLMKVSSDLKWQHTIYKALLECSGREANGQALAAIMTKMISTIVPVSLILEAIKIVPKLITALVDDPEAAKEGVGFFNRALDRALNA